MAYKVVFLKGDESVEKTTWAGMDTAIAHAKEDLPLCEHKLGATAVYVVEIGTSKVISVMAATGLDWRAASPKSDA